MKFLITELYNQMKHKIETYFLLLVITDFLDTTRKVMLKPYTVISVRPSQSNAIIHSNMDNFGPFRD